MKMLPVEVSRDLAPELHSPLLSVVTLLWRKPLQQGHIIWRIRWEKVYKCSFLINHFHNFVTMMNDAIVHDHHTVWVFFFPSNGMK